MKIERRKNINPNIMEELQRKYPVKSEKGICYEQKMDYVTTDIELFNNSTFRRLVKNNVKVLVVYMFLRERMCHNGWYTLWDDDAKKDVAERLMLWGVPDEDECAAIIDSLLDNNIIYNFQDNGIEYITDVQQIYNWEMLQAKRNRDRKSKSNNKATNDTYTNSRQYYSSEEQYYPSQEEYPPQEQYMPQEQYQQQEQYMLQEEYIPQEQYMPQQYQQEQYMPQEQYQQQGQYQQQQQYMPQEQYQQQQYSQQGQYQQQQQYMPQEQYQQQGFENNNNYDNLPFY